MIKNVNNYNKITQHLLYENVCCDLVIGSINNTMQCNAETCRLPVQSCW